MAPSDWINSVIAGCNLAIAIATGLAARAAGESAKSARQTTEESRGQAEESRRQADRALASLQEIRQTLIDKQVELSDAQDGPLYLLIDAMLLGIRQFFTYVEMLERSNQARPHPRFLAMFRSGGPGRDG